MREVKESDWKLFRKKLPEWQEAYMGKLNAGYAALLAAPGAASEKFWELESRIARDRRKVGVVAEMRRSQMVFNLAALLRDGAIAPSDLEGFSDELKAILFGNVFDLTK